MTKPAPDMAPGLSTYLDLLRLSAALLVFLSHLSWNLISGGFLWQLQFVGHDGVIVFFVLSGFVIPYATATKEKTVFDYQVARFARLYSVVLPALALTYLFDHVGLAQDASKYVLLREVDPLLRLVASGAFLSQSWGWDLYALNNDPFWSLPYEFWDYQIFAALIFFTGRKRIILVGLAAAIAGPPILVFLPLWFAGAAAYRLSQTTPLPPVTARVVFIVSSLAAMLCIVATSDVTRWNTPFLPPNFSSYDFLLGALIAVNIYSASFIDFRFGALKKPIVAAAGMSFSLYLLHLPLLRMASAYLPTGLSIAARGVVLMTFVLTAVFVLSFVTERRKKEWREFFRWIFSGFRRASVL